MANLNKVMLIGRLTRDPEVRTFSNGGKVAKFGFAVNSWRKNQQTGQQEAVFIDVDAFNRETRKLADLVEQYLRKGHQAYLEGSLMLDQWTDKDGQKRSKLKLELNDVQFLEPRADGGGGGGGGGMGAPAPRASAPVQRKPEPSYSGGGGFNEPEPDGHGDNPDDIPF